MAKLTHDFFNGDTVAIAQALLGKYLVRSRNGELLAGRITETEAYVGRCDKACHAYNYRRTPRTETLFMAPGHAYIYFIYGMYHCLNFVTEPEGEPSAVLLRGLEPAAGAETMKHLRFGDAPMNAYRRKNFLNGPGKVCKALDLTTAQNKLDLEGDVLFLCDSMADVGLTDPVTGPEHICAGPRIGVDYAEEASIQQAWELCLGLKGAGVSACEDSLFTCVGGCRHCQRHVGCYYKELAQGED